jgi:hypothetical protein
MSSVTTAARQSSPDPLARSIETQLNAAGRWFLHSGIQDVSGGVARYYRSDLRENARISTEITGYAISTLIFFHARSGEPEYLEAAFRAARFLTRTAWCRKCGAFPFEYWSVGDHCGNVPMLAYFFDTGIVIRGLLAAWRATQETEFRDTAITAGRAMLADFPNNGTIHPILNLPDKRPLAYRPHWSASPGCYQLKSAMAWFALFEVTGEAQYLKAYESALESAVASQREFLPGESDPQKVMDRLHAYAYFLEGLLPVLHRSDCGRIFREGLCRAAGHLRDIAHVFVRSDVCAQLLRLRLYGESIGAVPLDRTAAAHEAEETLAFQISSDEHVASRGGFLFGRKHGHMMPFVNPVSTGFCAQALALWRDRQDGEVKPHHHVLI